MLMMGCSASQIRRMMLLYQHQYVNRPSFDERQRLPEMIYWLDNKGTEYVASQLRRTISAWLNARSGLDSLHLEASLNDQVLNRLGVEDDARFTQTTSRWIS